MTSTSTSAPTPAAGDAASLHAAALQASQAGRTDEAIDLWKQCLQVSRDQPLVHYLLGAEYAEAKQYGEAVVHLSLAVEQAPAFAPVRLQLGLLWLTLGSNTQVGPVLAPLLALPESDPLRHYAAGLVAVSAGDLPAADRALTAGLGCTNDNAPLRADMDRMLARVRNPGTAAAPVAAAAQVVADRSLADTQEAAEAQHGFVISAYLSSLKH